MSWYDTPQYQPFLAEWKQRWEYQSYLGQGEGRASEGTGQGRRRQQKEKMRPNILFAIADDWGVATPAPTARTGSRRRPLTASPRGAAVHQCLHADGQMRALAGEPAHRSQLVATRGGGQSLALLSSQVQELARGAWRERLARGQSPARAGRRASPTTPGQNRGDHRQAVQSSAKPSHRPKQSRTTTTRRTSTTSSMPRPKEPPWCFWYGATEPHRGYEFQVRA